ncbi:hypothetical protein BX661DRAFT_188144 [Kickxella alabastrina]|uniref:uncharacterized protein n=1 Tax=Kickxella alabastrina TaxID=61397 RepID=UPI00221ECFFD|nr:uncharacterized protein BX661DRAFT_188144 [Kickxella alabastrina]KAI7821601.1 hypothetical protein BX661DRAFT_188144 [Kickxella alabastrina]
MSDYEEKALLKEFEELESKLKLKLSQPILRETKLTYAIRLALIKGHLYHQCKFTDKNPEVQILKQYMREYEAKIKHIEKAKNTWQSVVDLYNMKSAELCYNYKRGKVEDKEVVTDAEDDLTRMWDWLEKHNTDWQTAKTEYDEVREKLKTLIDEYRDAYELARTDYLECYS